MTTDIKWQKPPATHRGPGSTKWAEITAALRERPGEWALVLEGVNVGNGSVLTRRFPGFEFTTRVTEGRVGNVFGRYVGESA